MPVVAQPDGALGMVMGSVVEVLHEHNSFWSKSDVELLRASATSTVEAAMAIEGSTRRGQSVKESRTVNDVTTTGTRRWSSDTILIPNNAKDN